MAVGGRKASSLELGCDFLFDYTCSPCIADGKNKEALKFCVECGEYLCGDCLNNHNRFAKLKEHQVVEPAKYESERSCPNESDLPTITICCDKHSGKVLDMFCCDHDQVCCAVCLASDHRKCKRNAYIPEIAKDCQLSKEYKQQQKEKKKILSQLELIKQNTNEDLASQRRKKGDILKKFKQLREDIIKKVDNLEKRSMELVENRYQQNVSTVEEDLEEIDKMQKIVKTHDDQLKNENDDAQAFVLLKTGKKHVANTKDLMKRLQSPKNLSLDFNINKRVSDCFSGIRSFGSLNSETASSKVYSVQDKDEKYRCNVKSFCQLEDGCIVIADATNENVKKINPAFKVVDKCKLPSQPWSVCTFKNTEIAVSLCKERSIQFVTVKDKMQLTRSFKVDDTCTGLASVGDFLFVGCFSKNQIQTFNQYGRQLKTTDWAVGTVEHAPWCIVTSMDNAFLYIAMRKDGVVSIDFEMGKKEKIDIPGPVLASSLAASEGGLLVACQERNKVYHCINGRCETLLSEDDGIETPQAMLYYKQEDLIVASKDTDGIRVFSQVNKLLA